MNNKPERFVADEQFKKKVARHLERFPKYERNKSLLYRQATLALMLSDSLSTGERKRKP